MFADAAQKSGTFPPCTWNNGAATRTPAPTQYYYWFSSLTRTTGPEEEGLCLFAGGSEHSCCEDAMFSRIALSAPTEPTTTKMHFPSINCFLPSFHLFVIDSFWSSRAHSCVRGFNLVFKTYDDHEHQRNPSLITGAHSLLRRRRNDLTSFSLLILVSKNKNQSSRSQTGTL